MTPSPARNGMVTLDMVRCWKCGRALARLRLVPGSVVEIKCSGCHAFNTCSVGATVMALDIDMVTGKP